MWHILVASQVYCIPHWPLSAWHNAQWWWRIPGRSQRRRRAPGRGSSGGLWWPERLTSTWGPAEGEPHKSSIKTPWTEKKQNAEFILHAERWPKTTLNLDQPLSATIIAITAERWKHWGGLETSPAAQAFNWVSIQRKWLMINVNKIYWYY